MLLHCCPIANCIWFRKQVLFFKKSGRTLRIFLLLTFRYTEWMEIHQRECVPCIWSILLPLFFPLTSPPFNPLSPPYLQKFYFHFSVYSFFFFLISCLFLPFSPPLSFFPYWKTGRIWDCPHTSQKVRVQKVRVVCCKAFQTC